MCIILFNNICMNIIHIINGINVCAINRYVTDNIYQKGIS